MAKVKIGVNYDRLIRKMKDRNRAAELAAMTRVDVKVRATSSRSEGKNIVILRTQMDRGKLKLGLTKRQRDAVNAAIAPKLNDVPDNPKAIHQAADAAAAILTESHRDNIDRYLERRTGETEESVYSVVHYGR